MRYIVFFIAFILYFTVNLYCDVYNVFSNKSNIYYSTLENITNSFVLKYNNSNLSYNFQSYLGNSVLGANHSHNIIYSSGIKNIEGVNGGKALFFPNAKSYVKLDHYAGDGNQDFYNTMTSFTIEFYLNLYKVRMNSKVLSKVAIYNDNGITRYSGIKANIINGRLVWQFNNLFSYKGQYTNIILSGGEYLKENKWRHHSISFNSSTGKLVKYIDGLEEEVVYLTSTGDKNGSPYTAEFDKIKLEPLYLGQGFVGAIDSFYFIPNYKQSFDLYKYSSSGEVISKVIDFNNKNIFIDYINYRGNFTNGCYIDLYYRTSDYYFSPEDNNIEWQLLDNYTNIISSSSTRYIQIKALLKSNVDRNITPILNNVDIVYHNGRLPQIPVNVTAYSSGADSVTLKWDSSHEDVVGYKIYYGTKSGIYNDAEHIPIIAGKQNEYVIDGLNEGEVYYFTVTAIGGEGGNIESGFSKEVYVRPVH